MFIVFVLALFGYSLFSYILTEPNLVLSSNQAYWNFQQYMWDTFYHNSQFITVSFTLLVLVLFGAYCAILYRLYKRKQTVQNIFRSKYILYYACVLIPVLISYNALSHDVFNYAFNSKMVLEYQVDPHVKTALDLQFDDWVRFMHNIHTPAPYGYGWTALSLIPGFVGMQKLLPTLLAFRVFNILGIVLLFFALQHLSKTVHKRSLNLFELGLVFLNPLFLLEVVSNYHNDIWMLIPVIYGVSFLLRLFDISPKNKRKQIAYFSFSVLLLVASVLIKLVTVVLTPLYVFIFALVFFIGTYASLIQRRFQLPIPVLFISQGLTFFAGYIKKYVPVVVALFLFIPLFTSRSQQFHPWYWMWVLVWVPFINQKSIRNIIIVFSLSSLLRYIPWLHNSFEYNDTVLRNQKLITWGIPVVYIFTNIRDTFDKLKKEKRIQ